MSSLGYRIGVAGAVLGVVAGIIQWAFGDEIPEWTGNKLHPVQLGIITIVLSLVSLWCLGYLERNRGRRDVPWFVAAVLVLASAIICFTTVGRLWYVPGPLLLVSLALLSRR